MTWALVDITNSNSDEVESLLTEFIMEYDIWKKGWLENIKKVVAKFEKKISVEVRRQKKLDIIEKSNFRKKKLLVKYMSELKIVDLNFVIFFILGLRVSGWYDMTYSCHISVTCHGYTIIYYTEGHKRFWNNNIIIYIFLK